MKNTVIGIVVLILILGAGYMGRHQIKSLLGMNTTAPVDQTQAPIGTASSPMPTVASSSAVMTKTDATKGMYLADSKGMTLYTYDKDTTDKSNCTGQCLVAWPAFVASSADTTGLPVNISVLATTNQYAYKGMPLYYYQKDTKVGDLTGDGVGGVWHIIKQ